MTTLAPALCRLAADLGHDGHHCHASRADRAASEAAALEAALLAAQGVCAHLRADNTSLRAQFDLLVPVANALVVTVGNLQADLARATARADAAERTWAAMAADAATAADVAERGVIRLDPLGYLRGPWPDEGTAP